MPSQTVHCQICDQPITGYDFAERMQKLRNHRKKNHPKAHGQSVRKGIATKLKRGIIRRKTHDPELKERKNLIATPRVLEYTDIEGKGLVRVLLREDKYERDHFPEFAVYPKTEAGQVKRTLILRSLYDAGFTDEGRGKWVLRTNKFNLFVFV